MHLSSLHILLTYQCTLECDHCFVWGSPWQSGTLTLPRIREILRQARRAIASKFLHSANISVMAHRPRPRPLRAARADAGREQWPIFGADRVLAYSMRLPWQARELGSIDL